MNGTICYCKEKDCNKGGVTPSPTPPPSEKKRCLLCLADEDCFNNPDVDGESTLCDQQTGDTGCYKALVGKIDKPNFNFQYIMQIADVIKEKD